MVAKYVVSLDSLLLRLLMFGFALSFFYDVLCESLYDLVTPLKFDGSQFYFWKEFSWQNIT